LALAALPESQEVLVVQAGQVQSVHCCPQPEEAEVRAEIQVATAVVAVLVLQQPECVTHSWHLVGMAETHTLNTTIAAAAVEVVRVARMGMAVMVAMSQIPMLEAAAEGSAVTVAILIAIQ
jgi:hypothetical protein